MAPKQFEEHSNLKQTAAQVLNRRDGSSLGELSGPLSVATRGARSLHSKHVNERPICFASSACRAMLKCQPALEVRCLVHNDKLKKHIGYLLSHSVDLSDGRVMTN